MNATLALAATHLAHGTGIARLAEVDQNKVTPGLLGFVVFAAIGGALWLLLRSMNKQFHKVNFEEAPGPADEAPGSSQAVPAQAPPTAGSDAAESSAARGAGTGGQDSE